MFGRLKRTHLPPVLVDLLQDLYADSSLEVYFVGMIAKKIV